MKKLIVLSATLLVFIILGFVPKNNSQLKESKIESHEDHSGVCPDCNGVGNIICTVCNGDRTVIIHYDCTACYGKGMAPCTSGCNGSGYVACTYQLCNNGIVTGSCAVCYGKSAELISECKSCGGTGTATADCSYCKGRGEICHNACNCSGEISCSTCSGKGTVSREASCGGCEGNGYKKCYRCKGSGQVDDK